MDFRSTEVELTFSAGRTRVCTCIQITQDTEVEEDEQFSVSLTTSNPLIVLSTATTTVIIVDDDSRGMYICTKIFPRFCHIISQQCENVVSW